MISSSMQPPSAATTRVQGLELLQCTIHLRILQAFEQRVQTELEKQIGSSLHRVFIPKLHAARGFEHPASYTWLCCDCFGCPGRNISVKSGKTFLTSSLSAASKAPKAAAATVGRLKSSALKSSAMMPAVLGHAPP